jgi:hypothetical protein
MKIDPMEFDFREYIQRDDVKKEEKLDAVKQMVENKAIIYSDEIKYLVSKHDFSRNELSRLETLMKNGMNDQAKLYHTDIMKEYSRSYMFISHILMHGR